jgi:hypothetical protein
MTIKKILGWATVIFLAWFLITNPVGAAHFLTNLVNAFKAVGHSLAAFFAAL